MGRPGQHDVITDSDGRGRNRRRAPGRIEVLVAVEGQPGRRGLDYDQVVTGPQHQQIGGRPTQHGSGWSVQRPRGERQGSAQPERRGHAPVGQPG